MGWRWGCNGMGWGWWSGVGWGGVRWYRVCVVEGGGGGGGGCCRVRIDEKLNIVIVYI